MSSAARTALLKDRWHSQQSPLPKFVSTVTLGLDNAGSKAMAMVMAIAVVTVLVMVTIIELQF